MSVANGGWSIGRRLGAGFGAVIALLVVFALAVASINARSVEALEQFRAEIVPARDDALALERDILYVGLGVRNLWLDPSQQRRAMLRTFIGRVDEDLRRLSARPLQPQGSALFESARRQTEEYLAAVREVAAAAAPGELPGSRIDALRDQREVVLTSVRSFAGLQAERTSAAMREIEERSTLVTRSALGLLVLVVALSALVAWWTARSVRRPTRTLVAAARALGGGDWGPALALAPAAGDAGAAPSDELQQIARALGAAADRLAESDAALRSAFADLEQRNEVIARQNDELQSRNEELQAQNEEIQAQSEELQAQSEEIQAQSEEIQAQNDQLRGHAQTLLEADARRTHFLAVLAHELRNPLAPLTTSVALLRRSPRDSDSALRSVAVIERQVRQLARLVDDLLDVARISQGKIRLQSEAVDLGVVVRECLEDLTHEFEQRDIRLRVVAADRPLWVRGDRARLTQVTGNLVTNALKFTDSGGEVVVEVAPDPVSGTARLTVSDTGIGMDAALLERLFEPFTQGTDGLARPNSGLGLGLALVKGLVTLHGGTVDVASAGLGRGATFTVRLPLDVEPVRLDPLHEGEGPSARWRVLIVEDNEDAAHSLRAIVELDGHAVAVAHTGDDGVDLARRFRPHVVICDVGLPGIDGYTLARLLRQEPTQERTLLVALTARATAADRELAAAAGFDRHYAKPLDPEQLQEIYALVGAAQTT